MPSNIVITPASSLIAFTSSSGNTQNINQNGDGTIVLSGSTGTASFKNGSVVLGGSVSAGDYVQAVKSGGGYLMGISNGVDADLQLTVTASGAGTKYATIGGSGVTNLALANNGGKIGIGTITPEGLLTIKGTSAQPPVSGTTANSLLQLVGSLGGELNIGSNTISGSYGSYIQVSDNNLAVNYPLNLQPNGGNVGIGVSGASYTLDVQAGASNSAKFYFTVTGDWGGGANQDHGMVISGARYANNTNTSLLHIINNDSTSLFKVTDWGFVGINTTSPSAKLDVYAGADTTSNLVLWGQIIRNEGNAATTGYGAGLKLKISSDGEPYKWAGIAAVAGTGYSNRTDLALYTAASSIADATEKVRITGDGDLIVKGSLANLTLGSSGAEVFFGRNSSNYITANGGSGAEIRIISNTLGVVLQNGGTSWGSLSDENSKDIIEPIVNACYNLSQVRTVIGKYKTDNEDKRRLFLIAQDIEKIYPEAVFKIKNENQEESLGLNYTDLIPVLIKAIQEQQTQIQALLARIEILENN